ncbi:MAG: AAA family ATPase [Planctomycetaceae bacterium]|nr:AAA family ATPase [Planctomycetaceae bacterium]
MNHWQEIEQADDADIIDWAAEQPWARAMAACGQDAQWHAEGDVWTHTKLVCAELFQLDEWKDLSREEQLILLFTALLHDVGKPATTVVNPETGRTESPKHAVKGERIARGLLMNLETPFRIREEITQLVRYHGRPVFLIHKTDPQKEVISLSWKLNHRLLHLFTLADYRGRVSKQRTREEEDLYLWKLVAEENDCYTKPYSFQNDHARYLFYRGELSDLYFTPHEDYRCTVTVMSGLPGSGKDTWVAAHGEERPVVSMDAIRRDGKVRPTDNQGKIAQQAQAACRNYLRESASFLFNATNLTRMMRSKWIDLFHSYQARIEIVYVEPPISTLLQQNRNREQRVPEEIIHSMIEKLEPPTWDEGHRLQYFAE